MRRRRGPVRRRGAREGPEPRALLKCALVTGGCAGTLTTSNASRASSTAASITLGVRATHVVVYSFGGEHDPQLTIIALLDALHVGDATT